MTYIEQVSPLDICKENLLDVEEQLRFLIHTMKGAHISCFLPLLKGSFSSWIRSNLGILVYPLIFLFIEFKSLYRKFLLRKACIEKRYVVTYQKEKE